MINAIAIVLHYGYLDTNHDLATSSAQPNEDGSEQHKSGEQPYEDDLDPGDGLL